MKKIKEIQRISFVVLLACLPLTSQAQTTEHPISYRDYMIQVDSGNLDYAAQKLNVSIAEAAVLASKVRNDPELGLGYFNNEQAKKKMGYGGSVSLSQTLTFGKRTAAIGLAKSESELSKSLLADYLRNLHADATLCYLNALKQKMLCQIKQESYRNILDLARADSLRYAKGKIMAIDATQSKLEANVAYNDLLQSQADCKNAFTELSLYTGNKSLSLQYSPDASLHLPRHDFILSSLIEEGTSSRADLIAAMQNIEVAHRALKVAQRERNADITLSLEVSHNAQVKNDIAPAPAFTGISAGIAVPLPFSKFNKGNILAAKRKSEQANLQYEQAVIQVQNEIMKAYYLYSSASEQVKHYENGILQQAQEVLKGKIYSYNRGETSLLEVLNAQRTYNEVQSLYDETLYNNGAALVELERSAGIWDMEKYLK